MTSSVDPTIEIDAIKARLDALSGTTYEGVDQGFELPVDGFGVTLPYRDFQPGSTIPASQGRLVGAVEQGQPHFFAFQIEHVASTRKLANQLAIETDVSLIGWEPTTNAGPITTFYFVTYDATAKQGDRVKWIATRFYQVELGQSTDPDEAFVSSPGYGVGGYGT